MIGVVMWVVVIGSSIFVYSDAKSIGARKGLISGFGDMGPGAWGLCTLLLWIIGFPLYLAKRGEIREAALRTSGRAIAPGYPVAAVLPVAPPTVVPQPVGPPPGWYVDPADSSFHRWWDGVNWTDHRSPRQAQS